MERRREFTREFKLEAVRLISRLPPLMTQTGQKPRQNPAAQQALT
jgi:hypothetical protein